MNNLVTVFHCADCGNALDVGCAANYAKPSINMDFNPKYETGDHVNRISIKPCGKCKRAYSEPLIAIAGALEAIKAIQ